jgi:hypothetical protein
MIWYKYYDNGCFKVYDDFTHKIGFLSGQGQRPISITFNGQMLLYNGHGKWTFEGRCRVDQ